MLCPDCRAPLAYDWILCAVVCQCLVNRDGFPFPVRRTWFTDEQADRGLN